MEQAEHRQEAADLSASVSRFVATAAAAPHSADVVVVSLLVDDESDIARAPAPPAARSGDERHRPMRSTNGDLPRAVPQMNDSASR
jgi:hypothetical protein